MFSREQSQFFKLDKLLISWTSKDQISTQAGLNTLVAQSTL